MTRFARNGDAEESAMNLAVRSAVRMGLELRWVRDEEWGRLHIAAIDPDGEQLGMANTWSGVNKMLRHLQARKSKR